MKRLGRSIWLTSVFYWMTEAKVWHGFCLVSTWYLMLEWWGEAVRYNWYVLDWECGGYDENATELNFGNEHDREWIWNWYEAMRGGVVLCFCLVSMGVVSALAVTPSMRVRWFWRKDFRLWIWIWAYWSKLRWWKSDIQICYLLLMATRFEVGAIVIAEIK